MWKDFHCLHCCSWGQGSLYARTRSLPDPVPPAQRLPPRGPLAQTGCSHGLAAATRPGWLAAVTAVENRPPARRRNQGQNQASTATPAQPPPTHRARRFRPPWRQQIGRAHVELQSLMRISYAVFCLKKKKQKKQKQNTLT